MSKKHIKNGFKVLVFLGITQLISACDITSFVFIKKDYAQSIPKDNRKVSIEIPEVLEMMMVATVLSDIKTDKAAFLDTTTQYYQEVQTTFAPYKNHPLVKRLSRGYKKDFWKGYSRATISFQGSFYTFNNGKLQDENRYKMAGILKALPTPVPIFGKNKAKMEDFYRKTNFAAFYAAHKSYYDSLIVQTAEISRLDDIWQWLEANFPARKQSYRVITSPLMGQTHSTIPMFTKDKLFSEMVCFVSTITPNPNVPIAEDRFGNQRMFLTEIDENYAHVPSAFVPELKKAMSKNKLKWNNENEVSRHYKGAENTFNENFTHAVMACYGYDRYEPAVFEKKWVIWQNFMVKRRGFPMFKAFSDELLRLYKNRAKGQTVNDLFAPMVAWVKQNS
jgi:Domain of unknown function (DUF4932)